MSNILQKSHSINILNKLFADAFCLGLFYELKVQKNSIDFKLDYFVTLCSPPGTSSCVETLGERHQRCPALNHMCNQSKLTARRQVRVTSRPGCLKARDVQPAPAFCHSAKLSVCVSRFVCESVIIQLGNKEVCS